jgi:hypothetical protein
MPGKRLTPEEEHKLTELYRDLAQAEDAADEKAEDEALDAILLFQARLLVKHHRETAESA